MSYVRLREWHDVHQQLHALVTEMGLAAGQWQDVGPLNERPRRRRQIPKSQAPMTNK